RASGSVVYPEFHTRKTSSPITGIQWNRILKSTRSLSLRYWTNASRLVRVLKSYSNRLADSTAVNAPTGKRAVVRVKSVLTRTCRPVPSALGADDGSNPPETGSTDGIF